MLVTNPYLQNELKSIKDWAKFTNWVNQNVPLTSRFYRPLIFKNTEDEDRSN